MKARGGSGKLKKHKTTLSKKKLRIYKFMATPKRENALRNTATNDDTNSLFDHKTNPGFILEAFSGVGIEIMPSTDSVTIVPSGLPLLPTNCNPKKCYE